MAFDHEAVAQAKRKLNESAPALRALRRDLAKVDAEDLRAATPGAPAESLEEKLKSVQSAAAPTAEAKAEQKQQIKVLETARALVPRLSEISAATTFALDFIAEYDKTFTKLPLGKPHDYDPANDQPVELKIAANSKFADVFPPGTDDFQTKRAGTFKLTLKPRERLSLSIRRWCDLQLRARSGVQCG